MRSDSTQYPNPTKPTSEPIGTNEIENPPAPTIPSLRKSVNRYLEIRIAGMQITYYVMRTIEGWRVVSRGFAWEFDALTNALEFALDMAEQYARASGRTTNVRLQDEAHGEFREARAFVGVTPLHSGTRAMQRGWTR